MTAFNAAHRRIGLITVLVFLGTGVWMRMRFPYVYLEDETIRYLYRTNHVYILLSGLLNIAVGAYLVQHATRWRWNLQRVGSGLLLAAPLVLLLAFVVEPSRPSPMRFVTAAGILMLAAGTLCHVPGRR